MTAEKSAISIQTNGKKTNASLASNGKKGNAPRAGNGKKANVKLFEPLPCRQKQKLTLGQRWADRITRWAGSWTFILLFTVFLLAWVLVNAYTLVIRPFDPYPFILLNLFLSCLAAIQAPIILMSQNREMERDRHRAELDYYVNRRAEREIKVLQKEILEIKSIVSKTPREKEIKALEAEIQQIQAELEGFNKKTSRGFASK